MKKFILIFIASIGISFYLSAQSAGDYKSIGSGDWNDPTKWQIFNGNNWITATTYPGQIPGTGWVTIANGTEIIITATVPNPVSVLYVEAVYACYCEYDNYGEDVALGKLTFSAESAVSLTVTEWVNIFGELRIGDENDAKTHSIFIGGSLNVGDAWSDGYYYFQTPTVFQTINQDDKLNVIFNTTVPSSAVSGTGVSFQDVTFNGIGISFGTNVNVNGHANFINGIVTSSEYGAIITFGDGASYSGASITSFVEGAVSKNGNDAFTFPIGRNGIYAPLTISAPVGQTETFIASYNRSDAELLGIITDPGLSSVSNCEYWYLQPGTTNSNNYSLDVTVGWTTASGCGSSPYIPNVYDVTLARFNITTGKWDSHGGSGIGTTANGSVTSQGANMFGYFTLGNLGGCAAPFELNTTNIVLTSATLNWSALGSAVSYSVEYRPVSSSTWINVASATTSRSVNLTGLSPATIYYWRVRSTCTSSSSTYRQSVFTTPIACGDPQGLSATNITSSSATLTWNAATNALYYNVDYKSIYSSTWINAATQIPSLSYTLDGLTANSAYDWRVRAVCNVRYQGNYVHASYFMTLPPPPPPPPPVCNDVYETNNVSSQAKTISIGNTISAGISSPNDVDWFKVTTPNNSNTNLEVTLSNLSADYDLYVYNKSLRLVGSSANTGTANEVVICNSNARKATYYIKVVGKNGAYNTSQCYNLLAQVSSGTRSASGKSYPANEVTDISDKQLLYPNPASEFVMLHFNSVEEGPVNVQIFNTAGQLIKQSAIKITKGNNQVKIAVNDIKEGMYLLRINKGELNMTRKFVIAR